MVTLKKSASGRYPVQVKVGNGKQALRDSGTFDTRREAEDWYTRRRAELRAALGKGIAQHHTLRDALHRYAEEVAPTHKGERWERVRLVMFEADHNLPVTLPLGKISGAHIDQWVRSRLTKVSGASVRREMSLLGSVLTAAVGWGWLRESPLRGVSRPPAPPGSDVVMSRAQIKGMLRALGYKRRRPQSLREVIANMLILALRTGMRSGEMESLTWDRVHPAHVVLPETKNGDAREVPLPRKARPCIERMRGWDDVRVFPITAQSRDSLWRRARDNNGMSGFTFHASRHTAATWVGRQVGRPGRLSFPQFCKAFGWRNPKQALEYVNPTAAELADLL